MSVTHGADVEALRASSRELADVAQVLFDVNVRLGGHEHVHRGPTVPQGRRHEHERGQPGEHHHRVGEGRTYRCPLGSLHPPLPCRSSCDRLPVGAVR